MLAEIEVKLTSQTLVWQFRLSKSGPALRAPEISRASIASCDVTKSSNAKRCLAGRGRARQDFSQGERRSRGPTESMDWNHGTSTRRIYLLGCFSESRVRRSRILPVAAIATGRCRISLPLLGCFGLRHMGCNRIHQRRRQAIIGLEPEIPQACAYPVHLLGLDA
jgi:hypothetical protein